MNTKDWEEAYKKSGEIQIEVPGVVKDFLDFLKKKNAKKVLDLCFGTGRTTIFLAENGFDVYGIDISKTGKKITEKKLKEKNLSAHLEIEDMHKLPHEDNFFDAVLAIYCLEHNKLSGIKEVILELDRVLKPKGILAATLISIKDPRCGMGKKIEHNTFTSIDDPAEKDVIHHFSNRKEIKELFYNFDIINLKERSGYAERRNMQATHWEIVLEKI